MFKFIVLGVVLFAFSTIITSADEIDHQATIRSYSNVLNPDGSYSYQFETTNGIGIQESGVGGQYATGSAQHYAPDGTLIRLAYTADENGFQPQGDHLPTPPPIPEYILRALEWNKAHPEKAPEEPHRRPF